MTRNDEQLSDDALALDRYLNQYKRCIRRKRILERRRDEIVKEFDHPLTGINYDGMPHGSGSGVGCAAISFRLDEIDTKIQEQIEKSIKVLAEIMNVIEFLPENSTERAIIEHRYIDRLKWWQICKEENLSRTPANNYWRKGLNALLEFKKVQKIVAEYRKSFEEI